MECWVLVEDYIFLLPLFQYSSAGVPMAHYSIFPFNLFPLIKKFYTLILNKMYYVINY